MLPGVDRSHSAWPLVRHQAGLGHLQLVVAGGTFPWQTLPEPLTSLHHLMPMSYAVDGLRQLMYGGDLSKAGSAAIVLACVLLGALVMTAIGVGRMMRSRTLRDLQPSLIG